MPASPSPCWWWTPSARSSIGPETSSSLAVFLTRSDTNSPALNYNLTTAGYHYEIHTFEHSQSHEKHCIMGGIVIIYYMVMDMEGTNPGRISTNDSGTLYKPQHKRFNHFGKITSSPQNIIYQDRSSSFTLPFCVLLPA